MKKIICLSTLLVFLFTVSGCNLFKSMDKESDSDAEVFYYNAQSVINSGDTVKLEELETLIVERISDNPEEAESLNLMLSDVRLALSGVDLLGTASKLFDMVNSAEDPSNTATNITSIISMDEEQLAKLKLACEGYANLPTNPDPTTLTSTERNTYMTAGIAYVMYSANTILNVFDTNGDDKINELDTYADFTANNKQTDWNNVKTDLVTSLESSVAYLNVAFQNNTSDGQATTDNEEMVQTINEIKKDLNDYSTISSTNFTTIINTVLTGK